MRRAFTLTELLVVILILSILAGLALVGLSSAVTDAKRARTRTIINKVDALISEKWEGYRTRAVPVRIAAGATAQQAAAVRLATLRELQRIELPDRISDLCNVPELADLAADADLDAINDFNSVLLKSALTTPSSITRSYKRIAERTIEDPTTPRAWSTQFQGAECLYLILAAMKDGDKSALDFFSTDEIADTDGDGMKEVLDGWGRPLEFLRWTPGFTKENLAATDQTEDITNPDPFDPLKVDGTENYAIRPLIYSAGLDGLYEVDRGTVIYAWPDYPTSPSVAQANDPYYDLGTSMVGMPNVTVDGWQDNISNHYRE